MERDMLVRKFQKEHLGDLFAVIRKNLSGMECLARFAEEQRMGGEVGFFIEVEGTRTAVGWLSHRERFDEEAREGFRSGEGGSYVEHESSFSLYLSVSLFP